MPDTKCDICHSKNGVEVVVLENGTTRLCTHCLGDIINKSEEVNEA